MRDRDVRNAIQTALVATGAFDGVYVWGLPEDYGSGASNAALAVIEPESSTQDDRWDAAPEGGLIATSRVTITLIFRAEDPQVRDEAAEPRTRLMARVLRGSRCRSSRGLCPGDGKSRPRQNAESHRSSLTNTSSRAGILTTSLPSTARCLDHLIREDRRPSLQVRHDSFE
jgi:hypothetical protein